MVSPTFFNLSLNFTIQFSSLSHVQLFVSQWNAAHQASLSITYSQRLLKCMSIKSVMPFNHLILCHPLFLLPLILPSIKVFSSESVLHIRWPKYWSSASVLPMNIQDWVYLGWTGLISLLSKGFKSSSIPQFKSINSSGHSILYGPTSIHDYWKNISFDYMDIIWATVSSQSWFFFFFFFSDSIELFHLWLRKI